MQKKNLEKKLKEIDEIIKSHYKQTEHTGVLAGLSGISLFQFYYSKYLDINSNADIGVEIISTCIDKINNGYNFPTFCTGIAGLGWVLDHLEQENFVDIESDKLLQQFDDYLYAYMLSDLKSGNYDFLHGGIGYSFYFLNRFRNTKSENLKDKYKSILFEFIDLLEGLCEKTENNQIKWLSILNHDTGEKGYNLSLSHGMSSIIGILTKLQEYDVFKNKTEPLLKGAINYILSVKNQDKNDASNFPSTISENGTVHKQSRVAWCYGDLGVGIRLWFASIVLKDETLKNTAISTLKHNALRKKPENTAVVDASICHGSYGNAQIFNRMYKETGIIEFKKATDFWIQDGIDRAIHKDGQAGYKQYKGPDKDWTNEIILLEGIAGIGLTIIDSLASFNTNWDECLMIS